MQAAGRHAYVPVGRYAGRSRSRLFSMRSIGVTLLSFAAAILLASTAAGGTYALLSSAASTGPVSSIQSGTATLTVTPLSMPVTALYPGLTLFSPVTVSNVGNVPLNVQITSLTAPATTELSAALTIGLSVTTTSAACIAGATPTWTGTFASAAPTNVGPALAVGNSAVLCVSVALGIAAPHLSQNQTAANFGLVITGLQV
ncbi:hypothetical protein [Cryobacterium sp. PH29-G1]|uniref:hypothetical protein n=1 Tax=Cryobacterium sp. PH29-G1 TaxID=3046211 RepID=UPI0024B9D2C4|nr:hypothetical protein [Cryobacterium sp. PH29-G1]MDJ0350923.1 hypothetical protein [Cryobacterium sp. PH29-G1]